MSTYNSLVIVVLSTITTAKLTSDAPPNKTTHCTHISRGGLWQNLLTRNTLCWWLLDWVELIRWWKLLLYVACVQPHTVGGQNVWQNCSILESSFYWRYNETYCEGTECSNWYNIIYMYGFYMMRISATSFKLDLCLFPSVRVTWDM